MQAAWQDDQARGKTRRVEELFKTTAGAGQTEGNEDLVVGDGVVFF